MNSSTFVSAAPRLATPAVAPLGIYAKSSPPPPLVNVTGAAVGLDKPESLLHIPRLGDTLNTIRAERYELLATARKVLSAAGRSAGLQYGHDFHRTAKCKWVTHGGDSVGVHKDNTHGKAFFSNLVTCGSVWSCPVCAAKIQERRREEIAQAVDWAHDSGLQPVLVTLTFPHRSWHKLRTLLDQQASALARLRKGKRWDKFKEAIGYEGMIRSLELTHGQHGWHPHTHELWLVKKNVKAEQIQAEISQFWLSACVRSGLIDAENQDQIDAFLLHAVDVKGNCSASDYLAKQDDSRHWGVDRELAKASSKAGKAKGLHAFGLLANAKDCKKSARLFLIYTLAMKGKRQIFWSKGLKKRVGVGEITDEALAEQEREEADLLGQLDADDWHTVRTAGARAAVLDAAESGGWPAVVSLLERLTLAEIQRLQALLGHVSAPGCSALAAPPGGPFMAFQGAFSSCDISP